MPKPFLTYEQQIELLQSKGLVISDLLEAESSLKRIGYFPLIGGYKNPFKNPTTKKYKDGTDFSDILALYHFDADLRNLVLKNLLIVEREMKAQIAYVFCNAHGEDQAAYLQVANYSSNPKASGDVQKLVTVLGKLATHPTDYPYINHHQTAHHNVPLWVLINAITFGSMSKMFSLLPQTLQSKICKAYPLNIRQMEQMLSVLTKFRNVCAHGERLYLHTTKDDIADLKLHVKLGISKTKGQYSCGKRDLFAVIICLRYLLSPKDFLPFKKALGLLISGFTEKCKMISEAELLHLMGFPPNWKDITQYKL